MRRLRSLCLVVLATVSCARADVIRVPDDAPTVQAALDQILDTDTILVALGVYAEALIAPPLHFTLKGDVVPDTGEYPRPVIDPSSLPNADSLSCLYLPSESSPVLEDLLFRNGPEMYPHLIERAGGVFSSGLSVTFRHCILDSTAGAFYHWLGWGLDVVDSLTDCVLRDTQVNGISQIDYPVMATRCDFVSGDALSLCSGSSGSRITYCHFGPNAGGESLLLLGNDTEVSNCVFGPGTTPSHYLVVLGQVAQNVVVHRNVFVGNVVNEAVLRADSYAPQCFLIEDNTFMDNGANADSATCLRASPYHPFYAQFGGTISNNLFLNCFGRARGANVIETSGTHQWYGNHFEETVMDVYGLPTMCVSQGGNSLLRNNLFVHTGLALRNDASTVDAEWNWWGDASGPYHAQDNPSGMGDTIVGNVDFIPWSPDTFFLSVPGIGRPLPGEFQFEAYPNPFNSTVHLTLIPSGVQIVKVELFDLLGRRAEEVWHGPLAFQKDLTFDASALASGNYWARVTDVIDRKMLATAKLVLLK